MNVVVGDETGLLKLLDVEQQAVNKYSPEMTRSENSAAVAVQSRSYGVQGLCWNGGKKDIILSVAIFFLLTYLSFCPIANFTCFGE